MTSSEILRALDEEPACFSLNTPTNHKSCRRFCFEDLINGVNNDLHALLVTDVPLRSTNVIDSTSIPVKKKYMVAEVLTLQQSSKAFQSTASIEQSTRNENAIVDLREELKLRQRSKKRIDESNTPLNHISSVQEQRYSTFGTLFLSNLISRNLRFLDAYIFILKLINTAAGPVKVSFRGSFLLSKSSDAEILLLELVNTSHAFINSTGHYLRSQLLSNKLIQQSPSINVNMLREYHREQEIEEFESMSLTQLLSSNGSSNLFTIVTEESRNDSRTKEAKELLNERQNVANNLSNYLRRFTTTTSITPQPLSLVEVKQANKAIPQLLSNYNWFASLYVRSYCETARHEILTNNKTSILSLYIRLLTDGNISLSLLFSLIQATIDHFRFVCSAPSQQVTSNNNEPALWQLDLNQPSRAFTLRVLTVRSLGKLLGELLFALPKQLTRQTAVSNAHVSVSLVDLLRQSLEQQYVSVCLPFLLEIIKIAVQITNSNVSKADKMSLDRIGGDLLLDLLQRICKRREFHIAADAHEGKEDRKVELKVISSNRFFALLCHEEIMSLLHLPLHTDVDDASEEDTLNGYYNGGSGVDNQNWAMTKEFIQVNLPHLLQLTTSSSSPSAAENSFNDSSANSSTHHMISISYGITNNNAGSGSNNLNGAVDNVKERSVPSSPALSCDTNNTTLTAQSNTLRQRSSNTSYKNANTNHNRLRSRSATMTSGSRIQPQPLTFPSPSHAATNTIAMKGKVSQQMVNNLNSSSSLLLSSSNSPQKAIISPSKTQLLLSTLHANKSSSSIVVGENSDSNDNNHDIEEQMSNTFWDRQRSLRIVHDFLLSNFTDACIARIRSAIEEKVREFSLLCSSKRIVDELLVDGTGSVDDGMVEEELVRRAKVFADQLLVAASEEDASPPTLLRPLHISLQQQITSCFQLHTLSLHNRVLSLAIWLTKRDVNRKCEAMTEYLKEYATRKLTEVALYLTPVVMRALNTKLNRKEEQSVTTNEIRDIPQQNDKIQIHRVKSQLHSANSLNDGNNAEEKIEEINNLIHKLQTYGIVSFLRESTMADLPHCRICSLSSNSEGQCRVCCLGFLHVYYQQQEEERDITIGTSHLNHLSMLQQSLVQIMQLLLVVLSSDNGDESDNMIKARELLDLVVSIGIEMSRSIHTHFCTSSMSVINQNKIRGELGKFLISSLPLLLLLDEFYVKELPPSTVIIRMMELKLLTVEALKRALNVVSRDKVGSFYCHCIGVDNARAILQRQMALFRERNSLK